jgi:4'-phosphopantetheinyl transferase
VKAVGRGLALGIQSCVIAPAKPPYFLKVPENYGQASDWRLFDLWLKPDLYGALVLETGKISSDFLLPEITVFEIKNAL